MPGAVTLLVLVAVALAGTGWAVGTHNGLVGLRGLVEESWRQLDEELARRHELIPGLAGTARALVPGTAPAVDALLAAREEAVAAADRSAGRAGQVRAADGPGPVVVVAARSAGEAALSTALGRLLALTAGDPQLSTDQEFLALHRELSETEDRIVAGRRHLNDAVEALNTRAARFPDRLVARAVGIRPADPFGRPPADDPARPLDPTPPPAALG